MKHGCTSAASAFPPTTSWKERKPAGPRSRMRGSAYTNIAGRRAWTDHCRIFISPRDENRSRTWCENYHRALRIRLDRRSLLACVSRRSAAKSTHQWTGTARRRLAIVACSCRKRTAPAVRFELMTSPKITPSAIVRPPASPFRAKSTKPSLHRSRSSINSCSRGRGVTARSKQMLLVQTYCEAFLICGRRQRISWGYGRTPGIPCFWTQNQARRDMALHSLNGQKGPESRIFGDIGTLVGSFYLRRCGVVCYRSL
jgi:hypothetical protein